MNSCLDLPVFGPTCLGDLTVRIGSIQLDLTHPGVLATCVIALAIGLFVFRSPA